MILSFSLMYCILLVISLALITLTLYTNTTKNAKKATSSINNEYIALSDSIERYMDYFMNSSSTIEQIRSYINSKDIMHKAKLTLLLHNSCFYQSKILSLHLQDTTESVTMSSITYSSEKSIQDIISTDDILELKSKQNSSCLSPVYSKIEINKGYIHDIQTLSKLYTFDGSSFILTAVYNVQATNETAESIAGNTLDGFRVVDSDGTLLYQFGRTPNSDLLDSSSFESLDEHHFLVSGLIFLHNNLINKQVVISYISYYSMLKQFATVLLLFLVLYIASIIIVFKLLIPSTNKLLRPLEILTKGMQNTSLRSTSHISIHTNDEIEDVANEYNHMLDTLEKQLNQLIEYEKEKELDKYKLLVTQIEPHFIYNTMNIINILARQKKNDDIVTVNTALTRLLQDRLQISQNMFTTIQQEILIIRQYLQIMEYRYSNSVKVNIDVASQTTNKMIPKNIIQPLIENSYYHGLTSDEGVLTGNINISIYDDSSSIIIEVSDNGRGMTNQKIQSLMNNTESLPTSHIGIRNIQQRLTYLYNENASFTIRSFVGYGTTIIIEIPESISSNL